VRCSGPGRREQKKAATRRAIADAALRLAVEHGVDHVTVDQIAAEADVSPRTFFNYFASRDDAIIDVDPDATARLVDSLASRPGAEPPLVALRCAALEQLAAKDVDLDELTVRMALVESHAGLQARHAGHFAALEAALTDVVARRCGLDPTVDHYPAVIVAAAAASFRVAFQRALIDPSVRVDELVAHVFDLLEAGFPPPTGATCSGQIPPVPPEQGAPPC
jgi:AcrR family transcriptional regulator